MMKRQRSIPNFSGRPRSRGACWNLLSNRSGNVIIEFGLVSPILMYMMIASVQVGVLVYDQQTLQMVADKIQRKIITGQYSTGLTAQQSQTKLNQDITAQLPTSIPSSQVSTDIQTGSSFAGLSLKSVNISFDAKTQKSTNKWNYAQLSANSFGALRLIYLEPVIAPGLFNIANVVDGNSNLTNYRVVVATEVFKTESFS